MARVYARRDRQGTVWYIRYRFTDPLGKTHDVKERVGHQREGVTKTLAQEALKARLGEVVQQRFNLVQARRPVAFSCLLDRFAEYARAQHRSFDRERSTLAALRNRFGDKSMSEIHVWTLEQWKAERRKRVSAATVNRELTTLKALFRQAVKWDLTCSNPAQAVRYLTAKRGRIRYLTLEEIPMLLAACKEEEGTPWLYPLVGLALHTGLRQGELLSLYWDAIDRRTRLLTVEMSKNGEMRRVPLNPAALEILDAIPQTGKRLLAWPWGARPAKSTVHLAFKRACARAEIEDLRFHDTRHTFASYLVMRGVDLRTVQELLGHKSFAMTLRYSHLAPEHKQRAVDLLSDITRAPVDNDDHHPSWTKTGTTGS